MGRSETGVGLLGFGTVGTGTWTILQEREQAISAAYGTALKVKRILVRDAKKERGIRAAAPLLTERFEDLLEDDNIQIVVDVMGGEEPALSYILASLQKGRHLVTANKEVIAKHGPLIYETAAAAGCRVYTEACVAGGIPVLHPLQECFAGNVVQRVGGIINGTTNHILSAMADGGQDYNRALMEAQSAGYAEADPCADVEGLDALYKTVILAREGLGVGIPWQEVPCEGITAIRGLDMQIADRWNCRIKLVGIVERRKDAVCAAVQPMLIPQDHILAAVQGVQNGVLVQGDAVGEVFFAGPGAGRLPTGSAVVSDLVRIIRNGTGGERASRVSPTQLADSSKGEYYLRWTALTEDPGAELAALLAPYEGDCLEMINTAEDEAERVMVARIRGLTLMEKNELVQSYTAAAGMQGQILALRVGFELAE